MSLGFSLTAVPALLAGAVLYAGRYAQPDLAVMYASIAIGYAVWVALYRRVRGVAPPQQAALGSSAMSCAEGRVSGSVGRAGRLVPRRQRAVHPVRELGSTGAEAVPRQDEQRHGGPRLVIRWES